MTRYDESHSLDVSIPAHVVFRSFAEETVVLNLQSGCYHGLNPTAGRMLELMSDLEELEAVTSRLVQETGAPAERVSADLRAFCASLAERGLIEVQSGS